MLLFGPPGAGKGTQAAAVAAASGVPHIATGDMFREHLRSNSELGQLARSYMERGELVPDDVTIGMLDARIQQPDAVRGFVLDGFPRTLDQALALDRLLAERGGQVSGVLDIQVPEDELVRRLAGRLICRAGSHPYHVTDAPPKVPGVCDLDGSELYQRDDDQPDVIRTRFRKQWVEAAAPVIEYYRGRGLVSNLDAAQSREQVSAEVDRLLDGLGPPA